MMNCIIVKDILRFGRNYIEVGNYLENVYPAILMKEEFETAQRKVKNIWNRIFRCRLSEKRFVRNADGVWCGLHMIAVEKKLCASGAGQVQFYRKALVLEALFWKLIWRPQCGREC